jgi:hypothetical protein
MQVLIAIELIVGVFFVIVFNLAEIARDLSRHLEMTIARLRAFLAAPASAWHPVIRAYETVGGLRP